MQIDKIRQSLKPNQFRRIYNGIRRRTFGESHLHAYLLIARTLSKRRGTAYFTPYCPPDLGYSFVKILALLGISPSANQDGALFGVAWDDKTKHAKPDSSIALLNGSCLDISKSAVERAFQEAFGYSLAVNPRTYSGKIVSKSEENAAHDGVIVVGPIDCVDAGRVYQILVESPVYEGFIEEIRIPIMGSLTPIAYLKHRRNEQRFNNTNTGCAVVDAKDVISGEEQKALVRCARLLGMDVGELDTLRDCHSGKLYVIDANKTSVGPPFALPLHQKVSALKALAAAFENQFLQ